MLTTEAMGSLRFAGVSLEQLTETRQQRTIRLTGFDPCKCPHCKTGTLHPVELLPRIRSPDNVFYPRTETLNL